MPKFEMVLIRSLPGIDRTADEWDFGLVNFGYERADEHKPIALASTVEGEAIDEARHHWKEIASESITAGSAGYWVVRGTDLVFCYAVTDEDGSVLEMVI
jgi:hypothetical protein